MLDVVWSTHIAANWRRSVPRALVTLQPARAAALKRFGGKEEDHAGDGFFATFPQPDRAIRCAAALAEEVRAPAGSSSAPASTLGQTEDQAGKTHGIVGA